MHTHRSLATQVASQQRVLRKRNGRVLVTRRNGAGGGGARERAALLFGFASVPAYIGAKGKFWKNQILRFHKSFGFDHKMFCFSLISDQINSFG
jgi:hypothetical protein